MRAFVAIELPRAVREKLARLMERGKTALPKARWVNPDLLHITLVFLGESSENDLSALEVALRSVFRRHEIFDLELFRGDTFPPRRSARVAWVGVEGSNLLVELQEEVALSIGRVLGRAPEKRAFHAHVTVARCRQPWKRYAVSRYQDLMADFSGRFRVEGGVLMASQLGKAGARYTRVCTFPMGGS